MNKNEKQVIVNSLKENFEKSKAAFLIGIHGLNVESIYSLRKNLFDKGGNLKIAKNTLLKIAANDIEGLSSLEPYFKDQIAVVFVNQEAPVVAKVLSDASRANEKIKLIVGALDNKVIDASQLEFLAALPSKDILLAQVLGTLQAPISSLAIALNQLILKLLWVLKQASEKQ